MPTIATMPISGKTKPQERSRKRLPVMRARSRNAITTATHRTATTAPASTGMRLRAQQRISKHEAHPAQEWKPCDPVERASGKLAVHDRYSADHGSDRSALDKGRNERADREAAIPESSCSAAS